MQGKLGSIGRRAGLSLMALVVAGFVTDAWAEVGQIVVTTRKREENLQEVPIAVDAVTGETILQKGIVDLKGVITQSASLVLDQGFSPQDLRIAVRGLSPSRGRQNVAVLVDGIDVSSEAIGTFGGSLLINTRLFDMERVELVKGPQTALYGRSAFDGAISYITKKPGDTFEGRAGIDVGSYGQLEFSGNVSGPLTDSVSAGISGMVWSRDGYYTNKFTGEDMGDTKGASVASTVVWKPLEGLKVTGRLEYLKDSLGVTPYAIMPFNTTYTLPANVTTDPDGAGPLKPVVSPFFANVQGVSGKTPDGHTLSASMSEDPANCSGTTCRNYKGTDRSIARGTLDVSWDLGAITLTSLTHYATAATSQIEGAKDVSASQSPAVGYVNFDQQTNLFSQELRVQSNNTGRLNWTAGALYWQELANLRDGSVTCLNYNQFVPANTNPVNCGPYFANIGGSVPLNPAPWQRDTYHTSIYGLVDLQVLETLRVIGEGRFTYEKTIAGGPTTGNPGTDASFGLFDPSGLSCPIFAGWPFFGPFPVPPCPTVGKGPSSLLTTSTYDNFFTPKVTLQWTPFTDQMYYLAVAEAIKPKGVSVVGGGIGTFNPAASQFKEEKLWNYELGAKTAWFDRRLVANGALFYEDFKNKQVSVQQVGANNILRPVISNAGKARVLGAELDLVWRATDQLTMNASYTWLDTRYKDFTNITSSSGSIAYAGNCDTIVTTTNAFNPLASTRSCIVSYTGNRLEDAPKSVVVAGAHYEDVLRGATNWFVEGDMNYRSQRFAAADNQLIFPEYVLFNFRAGITNGTWDAIAYVDNAFNDDTVKTGFADGDIPQVYANGQFWNHGTLILPDPRTYGIRMNYHFGK